jgi:signal transduction histidine kinase
MELTGLGKVLGDYNIVSEGIHPYDILSHEIYIVNSELDILYANEKKKRKYGVDIIGKKCYEVFPSGRARLSHCANCPCITVFTDNNRNSSRNERFESIDKNNNIRYITETAVPLEDKDSRRVLALIMGRNITKRVKLENIKKDFYEFLGDEYEAHLNLVVRRIHDIGYKRVRLYDVIDDCLTSSNPLFVLRAGAGETQISPGYSFHLHDDGYTEVLSKLRTPSTNPDDCFQVEDLTEAKLLSDEEFEEGNKCVVDLSLGGIPWILLPLVSKSKLGIARGIHKVHRNKLVGLLSIDNKGGNPISTDDLVILKDFAEFLGEAITAVRSEMNLHIVNGISQLITQKRVGGETHELVAEEVCEKMQAGMCSIFIYSDVREKLEIHANYISSTILAEDNFITDFEEVYDKQSDYLTAKSFREGKEFNIIDFQEIRKATNHQKKKYRDTVGEVHWDYIKEYENQVVKRVGKRIFEIKNAIFAPLRFEDHNIGVIRVVNNFSNGQFPFPDSDIELLRSIALQIAAHSHYESMKSDIDKAISGISRSITEQNFELPDIAGDIVSAVQSMSKAYAVTLFLIDEGTNILKSIATAGYPESFNEILEYSLNANQNDVGIGITAEVALTGIPFVANARSEIIGRVSHSGQGASYGRYERQLYGDRRAESLIILPIITGNKIIGVMKVEDHERAKFGQSVRAIFNIMADLASLAIRSVQEIARRNELMIALGHELAAPAVALASMGDVMMRRYREGGKDTSEAEAAGEESVNEEVSNGKDEGMMIVRRAKLLDYCGDLVAESKHLTFLTSGRQALDTNAKYKYVLYGLKKTVWEIIDVLRPHANWDHIDILFNPNTPYCEMEMDRHKLKQALYNLIFNAIKYSNKEGIINVTLKPQFEKATLIIQDYGIGVLEKDKDMIFEKGYRGSNAGDKDPTGLGLGLHYTLMIIKGHRGTISLTNRINPTEFTMVLPLRQPEEN